MMRALEGVKVVELAGMWAAPTAGMYLADQGAEVIKIEPPGGDECRRFTDRPEHGNESPSFLVVNRSKRGMVVDIRTPDGGEILRKLIERSDVLIHNFRAGATERLGLRYEDLEPLNPGLVYVHVSPYGQEGPMGDQGGYDLVCQGLAGQMHRRDANGEPIGPGMFATDGAAGIIMAYGVALALLARMTTGRGQKVQTSLLQTAIAIQHVHLVRLAMDSAGPAQEPRQAVSKPYLCSDGLWVLPVPVGDKQFHNMYRVIGDPELVDNPAYATGLGRAEHSDYLIRKLTGIFAGKTRDEWVRLLEEHDVPVTPINSREEVFDNAQVVANDFVADIDHPALGRAEMTGIPLNLSGMPGKITRPAPLMGQHTDEVLSELGYARSAIEAFRRDGVIR